MEIKQTARRTTITFNTENRESFSLPDDLQEESEAFQFPGVVEKTATVKNKNCCELLAGHDNLKCFVSAGYYFVRATAWGNQGAACGVLSQEEVGRVPEVL